MIKEKNNQEFEMTTRKEGVDLLRFLLSLNSNLIFVKIFIYAPLTGSTDR
jgi:hypothetical protein